MTLGHLRITIRHFLGRGVQGAVVAGSTGRRPHKPPAGPKIGPRIRRSGTRVEKPLSDFPDANAGHLMTKLWLSDGNGTIG